MAPPRRGDPGDRPRVRLLVAALAIQLVVAGAFIWWAAAGFPLLRESVRDAARSPRGSSSQAAPGDGASGPVPRPRSDHFDAGRAWRLLVHQVRLGPRPAGSQPSRALADWARPRLPHGRFEAIPGHPGLRNVVGVLPGRRPALVIGAHYDTEATIPGHVGANDGAAGTAAVIELSRALAHGHRRSDRELRFVLFDGEEEPPGSKPENFYEDALRGSKAYAAAHARELSALVLLDYIAERNTRIPREGTSDTALWRRLRAAARTAGVGVVFPGGTGTSLYDDHTPFLRAGVTAIDVIDFDYPQRDTPQDDLDHVSARSLDAVGEAVWQLARSLTRRAAAR